MKLKKDVLKSEWKCMYSVLELEDVPEAHALMKDMANIFNGLYSQMHPESHLRMKWTNPDIKENPRGVQGYFEVVSC